MHQQIVPLASPDLLLSCQLALQKSHFPVMLCFGKLTRIFTKPSSRWQLPMHNKALQCLMACELNIGNLKLLLHAQHGTRLYAFLQLQAPRSLPRHTALAYPCGSTLTLRVGPPNALLLGGYCLVPHVFAGLTDLFLKTCLSHLSLVNLQGR